MLLGAAITRYSGWEGSIHIREGAEQNECYSTEKYIGYSVKDNSGNILSSGSEKYSLTSISAENYRESFIAGDKDYELQLMKIIPNADQNEFIFRLGNADKSVTINLLSRNSEITSSESYVMDGKSFGISYGSSMITLPFFIKLNDFILERYPGSNSPSGYKSDVILIDKAKMLKSLS